MIYSLKKKKEHVKVFDWVWPSTLYAFSYWEVCIWMVGLRYCLQW